jgi:hypothetical protein
MTSGQAWVDQVRELVLRAVTLLPESATETQHLTNVEPDLHGEQGWFTVIGRLKPGQAESISEGTLQRKRGDQEIVYDVLEVLVDGEVVRVRASITAPQARLELHVPAVNQRRILTGLADGLKTVRANPLHRNFEARTLSPIPLRPDLASIHGGSQLNTPQKWGAAACCSPGLQLMWGPPGTGKTHVIAASIAHLAGSGKRVLLVSSTNIAVDTAMHQAVKIMQAPPGAAVRLGTIYLPQLATDERVNLERLTEARQAALHRRLNELKTELDTLADPGERLAETRSQLKNFDAAAYQGAVQRIQDRAEFDRQNSALPGAQADHDGAKLEVAHLWHLRWAVARRDAAERESQIRESLALVTAELQELEGQSWWGRTRRHNEIERLRTTRSSVIDELTRAAAYVRQVEDAAQQAGVVRTLAGEWDAAGVDYAERVATERVVSTGATVTAIRDKLDQLAAQGLSQPADRTLVTDQRPLWELHETIPTLENQAEQAKIRVIRVTQQYEQVQKQITQEKREVQQEIVAAARLVGTTLTQIALRPWITEEQFDHVIIDEAAAAQFPHVVHAVGRARIGATLVGDYLQNGPIVSDSFLKQEDEIRACFKKDSFDHFEATRPGEAKNIPGCVVLTEQFRFGQALTELANRVAYDNWLTCAGSEAGEIVVITVDGLPEQLRTIDHSEAPVAGWWPIGALLARSLGEYHQGGTATDAFGVVVPYRQQQIATEAALDDAGLRVPVGTAHAFQGRQFDTVLADLVEDGTGWIAQANRQGGDWPFDGLRLFNVAATRPRHRLYVLATRKAVDGSKQGPLRALKEMVLDGTARMIDAGTLLGLSDVEAPVEGTPEADLLAALDPYVRVIGIHDEDATVHEVIGLIDRAEDEVWCWSAWIGKHATGIADALERAHRRGVKVHLIARPAHEVTDKSKASLLSLHERLPHVVFMRRMHQKIVVADQRISILGSMNVLSHGQTSSNRYRDVMVTMDGKKFTQRLLAHENAAELARRRICPACKEPLRECGLIGANKDRRWAWICTQGGASGRGHGLDFPGPRQKPARRR